MSAYAPQIIYLGLIAVGLGVTLARHGQPREPHNFWASSIAASLALGLLYWGGFFS